MIVLGIDPGYERLGISVIEKTPSSASLGTSKPKLVFSECFKTSPKDEHAERLSQIHIEIERILNKYKPSHLGIETLFFNANVKTAMKVAESRGVILALAKKHGLTVVELSPQEIKIAVTGYGNSDKKAVIKMIPLLIDLNKKSIMLDDEYDAIGVGLCVLTHN